MRGNIEMGGPSGPLRCCSPHRGGRAKPKEIASASGVNSLFDRGRGSSEFSDMQRGSSCPRAARQCPPAPHRARRWPLPEGFDQAWAEAAR